jgi:hypothetical protein
MHDVDFPVKGVDNLGNEMIMMPGEEYTFPGDYVVETPAMQLGGTRRPIFTSNPNDPRIQNYGDSLNLYNYSKNLSRSFPNLPEVTEQQYKQLQEKDNNLLNYEFDQVAYKKDKNEGKVKNFDDYIYSGKKSEIHNTPQYLKNNQIELDKYSSDETGKYNIELPDGTIKSPGYLYDGKPQWDDYSIWNPNTKTSSHYTKNFSTGKYELSHVLSDNIKPIKTKYFGEDKTFKGDVISTSSKSTGWYKKGEKPVFKTDSKKEYVDTHIPLETLDIYKKPVQPVIYKKQKLASNATPTETSTLVNPTITSAEPASTPKVERKVVSVAPEEVKAGTKTTSGKQIGSGTAGGRIYRVKYDNGETEILNEFEYRSKGIKMQAGGQTGWLDNYQDGGPQMYPGPSLQFQQQVQNFVNKTPNTFVRREPITVSQTDNTRTNAVENAKRDLESYTPQERAYFAQNNIPRDQWFTAKTKMQNDAVLKRREEIKRQAQADVRNNPFAITPATNEQLRNEFRAFPNDPNNFFDEYLNPAQMIGNLAASIGDNFTGEGPIDPWKLATDIVTPAFVGMTAGIGAQNTGQFANNLINPLAGMRNPLSRRNLKIEPIDNVLDKGVLEEIRYAFHNNERRLSAEERKILNQYGLGQPSDYMDDIDWHMNNDYDNYRISAPPSEIRLDPELDWLDLDWNNASNELRDIFTAPSSWVKPRAVNKSGLTLEQTLQKVKGKDKDTISKMSETEFENTVLKPDGEVIPYYQGSLEPHFRDSQKIVNMSLKEYVDFFNSRLDILNDIIAKKNKSGVKYRVKGLDENGYLQFETPEQTIIPQTSPVAKERIKRFNRNPEEFLKNEVGLYQDGNLWRFPENVDDVTFNSIEEAVQFAKKELESIQNPSTLPSGISSWRVRIKPGQWSGDVEDVASEEYFKSIPGLEMTDASAGVFPPESGLRGLPKTKAYESINEYLKTINLGRVKPGFNSQTETVKDASGNIIKTGSKDVWEHYINSGKAVGFYGDPRTVYGTMKTLAPIGVGIGAGAALKTKEKGGQTGWLDKYK